MDHATTIVLKTMFFDICVQWNVRNGGFALYAVFCQ